jgi:lactoylglutathione lyase
MIPIEGLFETHITVRDLERSIAFYRDVVGLELGIVQPERPAAFFWVGGRGRSMLGVFSLGSCPLTMQHHLAFQVRLEDVLAAPQKLRAAGISPLGGSREPINEPVVFAWGPAASVFFDDPDGNLLEYISMLPGQPQPELGLLSWREWQRLHEYARG